MSLKQRIINLLKYYNQSWRLDPHDDPDLKECDISDREILTAVEEVFLEFEKSGK